MFAAVCFIPSFFFFTPEFIATAKSCTGSCTAVNPDSTGNRPENGRNNLAPEGDGECKHVYPYTYVFFTLKVIG